MNAPKNDAKENSAFMNAADSVLSPERVAAHPDKPAILFNGCAVSYRETLALVNRYGNAFRAQGVERENRIMMLLKDTPDMVGAYLGAIKIGAVTVAVNVRSSSQDLLFFLNDSRAKLLLIDAEFLPLYEAIADQALHTPRVYVAGPDNASAHPGLDALLRGQSDECQAASMSPDDMAVWMYTSGTTGTPKAAVHLHHNILSCLDCTAGVFGATADDRLFATSKLFFAYANSNCLFASFTLGATTILYDGWPDSEAVAKIIDRDKPTMFFSVPTMYRNLLRDGVATKERFAGIRICVTAGERLPMVLFERWKDACGRELIDALGTTETIFMILANPPGAIRPGSSGKPTPNTRVELRDETAGLGSDPGNRAGGSVITGPGKSGVLWVNMASLADRYWNQQARSNAAFFGPWFRTGDMYSMDKDGYYFQEGRADDMLRISGQWVSPAEIEEEVLKLPQVADAAVVGVANADGVTRLSLFVIPNDPHAARAALSAEIQDGLRDRLSIYKCPRDIHFVDEIPRTATGKVQRYRLRTQVEQGRLN